MRIKLTYDKIYERNASNCKTRGIKNVVCFETKGAEVVDRRYIAQGKARCEFCVQILDEC